MLKRIGMQVLMVLASWAWSTAMASVTITTDSAFRLSGSFSALSTGDAETVSSAIFGSAGAGGAALLPGSASLNFLRLWRSDLNTGGILLFQTAGIGSPDNPSFVSTFGGTSSSFAVVSGVYNNNLSSTDVYFLFSNLADSGGPGGLFSGNFDFSTASINAIPEPEIYAMMVAGLGVVGFVARRKRKLQASTASC